MNFYHACYTRQYYDEEEQTWRNTDYKQQGIIVIADNYNDALDKAKEAGWIHYVDGNKDYCPDCQE